MGLSWLDLEYRLARVIHHLEKMGDKEEELLLIHPDPLTKEAFEVAECLLEEKEEEEKDK